MAYAVYVNVVTKKISEKEYIVDAKDKWDAERKAKKAAAKDLGVNEGNVTCNSGKTKKC